MVMKQAELLSFTDKGIYCPLADVYIDPWKPVRRALITHAHSDHARWGHQFYLTSEENKPLLIKRLGAIRIHSLSFGEPISINGVKFSFHPAGHIVGSAQIRVEYRGNVWVVSGDYKKENDGLSGVFEPLPCRVFITESTFGIPVYKWQPQETVMAEINRWWHDNNSLGITSILTGYALGKAQRLLKWLDPSIGPIYTHETIEKYNQIIRGLGKNLPTSRIFHGIPNTSIMKGAMILITSSLSGDPRIRRMRDISIGTASGWMQLRGARRRRSVDRGFVLSDHVDWIALNNIVEMTGAEKVYVTHGYKHIFSRWLNERGIEAEIVQSEFDEEWSEGMETPEFKK
jgi:putative mRNA 3-end processing factor